MVLYTSRHEVILDKFIFNEYLIRIILKNYKNIIQIANKNLK